MFEGQGLRGEHMVGKLHCRCLLSSLKVKHLRDDRSRSYRIIIMDLSRSECQIRRRKAKTCLPLATV